LLAGDELPFNEGLLEPVELIVPRGILSPDFSGAVEACPAIVGGNVETSQCLVDLLLAALGWSAGSQGTMNNVSFGNERFGYYETLGGGTGAGPHGEGASAVHSHMTNTRITDVEVLEHRYPVRVRRFLVRCGSGGRGQYRGGNGLVRELEFTQPVQVSLLTQHRAFGAAGAAGGADGAPGRQWIQRRDGGRQELPGIGSATLDAGDRLVVETPGGGGWGKA
jgi:5-oxoprolinase (ATP-hydrolysing)